MRNRKVTLLSIISSLFLVSLLNANPIAIPSLGITEFYFNSSTDWQLELNYETYGSDYRIDSLIIIDGLNCCIVTGLSFENDGLFVIENSNLSSPIEIDTLGDSFNLLYCISSFSFTESLVFSFGNKSELEIDYPKKGFSLAFNYDTWKFCLDSSPTIGEYNDTSGMNTTLSGIVYDCEDELLVNTELKLTYPFQTDEYGNYSTRIPLQGEYSSSWIRYLTGLNYKSARIMPFTVLPVFGEELVQSIYLTDSLVIGGNNPKLESFPVQLYPNPVQNGGAINYTIDLPVYTIDCKWELLSIDGRKLFVQEVNNSYGEIQLPLDYFNGIAILNLIVEGRLQYSEKILIQ